MAKDFGTRKPFDGVSPKPGETLVPVFVSSSMLHSGIDTEALETWHIGKCGILVGFVAAPEDRKEAMMKMFNEDVRNYIACGCPWDFCPGDKPSERGHDDDLSFDRMIDDVMSEDGTSFEPAANDDPAATAVLSDMLDQLMEEVSEKNPLFGDILAMLTEGSEKAAIVTSLPLGKSQAYKSVKDVQSLARAFFGDD